MMIWNACKIILATDRLTPALIWSQTTRVDTICTIDTVGSKISELFISQGVGISREGLFHTFWILSFGILRG